MAKQTQIGLGLIGFGNVGREVFRYFRGGRDGARVVRIARRGGARWTPQAVAKLLAPDAHALLADPAVDLVVELTGDAQRGASYMLEALERGKHVVTANKGALAERWRDIMSLANRRGCSVGFEATVGGGMPIVRAMQRHLAHDEVEAFAGILNGTCNFILTRMREYVLRHIESGDIQKRSLPLEQALAQAQKLGYAEPDPTLDLNGSDTTYKVAILANLAFGASIDPAAIYCEGIVGDGQQILPSDIFFLQHRRYLDGKYALKLVGVAERRAPHGERPTLRVHPALIDRSGRLADLAAVDENFNGIVVRGRRLGTQFLKGLGAGPKPTTVSVASDIAEIVASVLRSGSAEAGPPAPLVQRSTSLGNVDSVHTRGFIRSVSPDVKGVYARKLEILARHRVSVQSVVNVGEFLYGRDRAMPDYIEIDAAPDGAVRRALDEFRRLRDVRDVMYFRVLEL